jgi:DNA-binding response OmpR family regulator
VFVAAGLSPTERRRLQVAGAADVIPLPFEARELPKLIRSIWSRIED